jgi:hypothetical protein
MCVEAIGNHETWEARNGSTIGISKTGRKFTGTVLKSTDRKFPIGFQVNYKSEMGHVLCKGDPEGLNPENCELHPLDATEPLSLDEEETPRRIREALRRRRYNVRRSLTYVGV